MPESVGKGALAYLSQLNPAAAESHRGLRQAVLTGGPLKAETCELIVLGALAAVRSESGVKAHARRLLEHGVSKDMVRHAVMVTLGAAAPFPVWG